MSARDAFLLAAHERLLEIVLPRGGYVAALAEAYFDESSTGNEWPFLCVAGYIFTKENAQDLSSKWRDMLDRYGLPYFHMSECAHNKGIYAHLSRPQCDQAAREAIELIKLHASKGIALSMDKSAWQHIPQDGTWSSAYAFLCGNVFFGVRNWAEEARHSGEVAYFYESGADGWHAAAQDIERLFVKSAANKKEVRHFSHTCIDKASSAPLQCADLLAWHWHTYNRRRVNGNTKKRADFANLIGLRIDPHHYDKETILRWNADWTEFMRLQGRDMNGKPL